MNTKQILREGGLSVFLLLALFWGCMSSPERVAYDAQITVDAAMKLWGITFTNFILASIRSGTSSSSTTKRKQRPWKLSTPANFTPRRSRADKQTPQRSEWRPKSNGKLQLIAWLTWSTCWRSSASRVCHRQKTSYATSSHFPGYPGAAGCD